MCMLIITLLCIDLCGGKVTKYLYDPKEIPKQLVNSAYNAAIKGTLKEVRPVSLPNDTTESMDLGELIRSHGLKEEVHELTTADGYVLGLYRVPGSGPAVLLAHGMLDSGDGWVVGGNDSLGVLLAREGYDVWIYNSRGTRYSRRHVSLTPEDNRYWRFDWDEMGRYDLPKVIDHVTRNSTPPHAHLHYVGFQQGVTALLVMCGIHRGLCDRVCTLVAVAPAVYLGHVAGPLRAMADIQYHNREFVEKVADSTTSAIVRGIREPGGAFQVIGADGGHISPALWKLILSHVPETAATRQVLHFGQLIRSGQFTRYDYGEGNLRHYHAPSPPPYPLSHFPRATCLYYSRGDRLVEVADVAQLKAHLPPLYDELVLDDFNHLDLMFAPALRTTLYDRVLKVLFARERDTRDRGNHTLTDSLLHLLTSTTGPRTRSTQYHWTTARAPTHAHTPNTTTTRKKRFKIPKNMDMHQMISLMKNVKVPPKRNVTTTSDVNVDRNVTYTSNVNVDRNENWNVTNTSDVNVDSDEDWNRVSLNNVTVKLSKAQDNETVKLLTDIIIDHKKRNAAKNPFKQLSLIPRPPQISLRTTSTARRTKLTTKSQHQRDREAYFAAMRTTTGEPVRGKKGHLRMKYRPRKPDMYMPIVTGRFLEQRQAVQAMADAPISYYIHKRRRTNLTADGTNKSPRIRSKRTGINLRRLGSRHKDKWRNFTFSSIYLSNVRHTHD